jgi:antirestriction protein ArdC
MNEVHSIITGKILEALDKGILPWSQPWNVQGMRNAVTKKLYRGINVLLLSMLGNDNYFLTYRQAQKLGGYPRKSSKIIPVCFYKTYESKHEIDTRTGKPKQFRILRYYKVFSVNDCEGLKWKRPETKGIEFHPIAEAESLVQRFLDIDSGEMPFCPIAHGGDRAFYRPSDHSITMPHKETFKTEPHYYGALLHEMGHALHRVTDEPLASTFGDESYSKEELTAEIFASFGLNHCGLLDSNLFNHSIAYLQAWRKKLDQDHNLIISAASKAQRRFDKLLGVSFTEETNGNGNEESK